MELWSEIIHTAMLGTDKKTISADALTDELTEAATLINNNTNTDKEEKFLQLASVTFNYRQSGALPLHKEEVKLQPAPAEEKKYCSSEAMQALQDILSEESIPLLKFWLQLCSSRQQIVNPALIPSLFSIAMQNKNLQSAVANCCGKRGEWLARFNDAWNFSASESPEQIWQTGTPEQRRSVLKETRKKNPSLAREWLIQTWSQEDAAARTSFLELLNENISGEDIPFLEQSLSDKSKKVKEEALNLLKLIPSSSIVQLYEQVIQQALSVKKEKTLLGLSSKTIVNFTLPVPINEEVFKSGIQKLSSQKNISDESFIIFQLVSHIPPSFLEKHLGGSPPEIISWLKNSQEGKDLLPAIGLAAGRFKDRNWAAHIINDDVNLYFDLIPLLPQDIREKYLLTHFNNSAQNIIDIISKEENEWSFELTKHIFRYAAKHAYQYNRSFYNTNIHLFPVQIAGELERCTPPEENLRDMWSKTSDYIIKLISLKIQTIKAFT
jgi:hypothetical protein